MAPQRRREQNLWRLLVDVQSESSGRARPPCQLDRNAEEYALGILLERNGQARGPEALLFRQLWFSDENAGVEERLSRSIHRQLHAAVGPKPGWNHPRRERRRQRQDLPGEGRLASRRACI